MNNSALIRVCARDGYAVELPLEVYDQFIVEHLAARFGNPVFMEFEYLKILQKILEVTE